MVLIKIDDMMRVRGRLDGFMDALLKGLIEDLGGSSRSVLEDLIFGFAHTSTSIFSHFFIH
jgi:hypothetical protein